MSALHRVRAGFWPSAQCGLAASGAWAFAQSVLDHPRPFFASVAAVVALGVSGGSRLRRTAELAFGVALGVAVGDLLVGLIGQGAWQIGVVVGIALLVVLALGGKGLAVTQAGLQAVFVVALPRVPHSGLHRWQDALVGGAAALLVAALLPADPWREVRRRQAAYLHDLASVLHETARGARAGSGPGVAEALARGRELEPDLHAWERALEDGEETARLSPLRRRRAVEWQQARALTGALTRSTRNLRVLVRRVLASTEAGVPLAVALPELLDELASVLAILDGTTAGHTSALAPMIALAGRLDPAGLDATSLADQVVVGQLRVTVLDLLVALGMSNESARRALPQLSG